jgi:hypothetical protein
VIKAFGLALMKQGRVTPLYAQCGLYDIALPSPKLSSKISMFVSPLTTSFVTSIPNTQEVGNACENHWCVALLRLLSKKTKILKAEVAGTSTWWEGVL